MKKIFIITIITVVATIFVLGSCTENERAKNFGGNAELVLPQGQKLVTVTWRETSLWYLTRPMTDEDIAETYSFKEESSYGVWEGIYTIREVK